MLRCIGAELGELDGLRIATHWSSCDDLAKRFPDVKVDPNALFVVDGKAGMSAGVTIGIDMALAMVERDVDHTVADKIAKFLVLYLLRPGYQSQFSDLLKVQTSAGYGICRTRRLNSETGSISGSTYPRWPQGSGCRNGHFIESSSQQPGKHLLASSPMFDLMPRGHCLPPICP